MQSQTLNEEDQERNYEISQDYSKARNFPDTIIGRKRLRGMRVFLGQLDIHLNIPFNSAAITDEYCKKYANEESANIWNRRQ